MLVTAVTITRTRPALLDRALRSVQRQDLTGEVEHLVLADDCPETGRFLRSRPRPDNLRWMQVSRTGRERSGPGRSARLRNMAVRLSDARWIAFLDDDNEWTDDHLSSLVECARSTGRRAVHSHLQMRHRDGSPYLDETFPWERDDGLAKAKYAELVDAGVVTPGSCVWRDQFNAGPAGTISAVDTGEWLLRRDLLLEIPFCETFTAEDEQNVVGEDDKLAAELSARGEPVSSSRKPTLLYYLGGYSNNFHGEFDPNFSWTTGE